MKTKLYKSDGKDIFACTIIPTIHFGRYVSPFDNPSVKWVSFEWLFWAFRIDW